MSFGVVSEDRVNSCRQRLETSRNFQKPSKTKKTNQKTQMLTKQFKMFKPYCDRSQCMHLCLPGFCQFTGVVGYPCWFLIIVDLLFPSRCVPKPWKTTGKPAKTTPNNETPHNTWKKTWNTIFGDCPSTVCHFRSEKSLLKQKPNAGLKPTDSRPLLKRKSVVFSRVLLAQKSTWSSPPKKQPLMLFKELSQQGTPNNA